MKPSKTVKPAPTSPQPLALSVETLRSIVGGAANRTEQNSKR